MSPWARIDDDANDSDKLLALSDAAWRMWGCGLIYCQKQLTNGFIPEHKIHTFGVKARNKPAVAAELCRAIVPGKGPLWHKVDGGYQVHDYLDWNETRDEVLRKRQQGQDRLRRFKQRHRNGGRNAEGNAFPSASETDDPRTTSSPTGERRRAGALAFLSEDARALVSHYEQRYLDTVGVRPVVDHQVAAAVFGDLLAEAAPETVRLALDALFDHGDAYVRGAGYALRLFQRQFNAFLLKAAGAPPRGPVPLPDWLRDYCLHTPCCASTEACRARTAAEQEATA